MNVLTIAMFAAGCVVGALACYAILASRRTESAIERQMRELQEEFTAYRENVNQHFNKTAQLVNSLTENYIAVQKHLEDAAVSFSEPPKSFELAPSEALPAAKTEFVAIEKQTKDPSAEEKDASFGETSKVEAPKDYAPKNKPDDKGTLSEGYGLDSKVY